jgi:lipopolysaccharide biosynthesis glycosyltransferase
MHKKLLNLFPWRFRSLTNYRVANANSLFRAALTTPPLAVAKEAEVEVHSLVCKRDTNMLLVSAKSLLQYLTNVSLVIHEDGSLNDTDCAILLDHLPGCRLIRRCDADQALKSVLPIDVMKWRQEGVFLLKLIDFNYFCSGKSMIVLDSDIVFLDRPSEVIEWIAQEPRTTSFYNQDIANTFRANSNLDRPIPPLFNAGFMGLSAPFHLSEILAAMRILNYRTEDQTIYSWLMANENTVALPRDRYFVFDESQLPSHVCMVHFISQHRFTTDTYIQLARQICDRAFKSQWQQQHPKSADGR